MNSWNKNHYYKLTHYIRPILQMHYWSHYIYPKPAKPQPQHYCSQQCKSNPQRKFIQKWSTMTPQHQWPLPSLSTTRCLHCPTSCHTTLLHLATQKIHWSYRNLECPPYATSQNYTKSSQPFQTMEAFCSTSMWHSFLTHTPSNYNTINSDDYLQKRKDHQKIQYMTSQKLWKPQNPSQS